MLGHAVIVFRQDAEGERRFAPFLEVYLGKNPIEEKKKAEQIAIVKRAGERMNRLIGDLLDVADDNAAAIAPSVRTVMRTLDAGRTWKLMDAFPSPQSYPFCFHTSGTIGTFAAGVVKPRPRSRSHSTTKLESSSTSSRVA